MLRTFWDVATELNPGAEPMDEKHMPLCRSGQLSRLWEGGGLQDVVETGLSFQMQFASFDDFWEPFLGGQGPAGAYVESLGGRRQKRSSDRPLPTGWRPGIRPSFLPPAPGRFEGQSHESGGVARAE